MFYSILFEKEQADDVEMTATEPAFFHDLNLDRVFNPVLKQMKDFSLERYFYQPLHDVSTIEYRQEVFFDLESGNLREPLTEFSELINRISRRIQEIRKAFSSEHNYDNHYLTKGRYLNYADQYRTAVLSLEQSMRSQTFHSRALRLFSEYLSAYCASEAFIEMCKRIDRLRSAMSKIQYNMLIHDGAIRIRKYEQEEDLAEKIVSQFEKFRQGEVKDYRMKVRDDNFAPHIEAAVLGMLATQEKDAFSDLDNFFQTYREFLDEGIVRFAVEIQFYLAWLMLVMPLREAGLRLCYPTMENQCKHISFNDGYDIALALFSYDPVVPNDVRLDFPERILVVTGPNQGGKTTFARSFAQIHYLASLGLSVPGTSARLLLFDRIFTHFGREEDLSSLNGKLQDDLVRLKDVLDHATENSIIIINEIFTSTTLADAVLLGRRMMEKMTQIGAITVCVTFLDELTSFDKNTVSMMSTVDEVDPTKRTFRIIRKEADGLAFALHIARKNSMTYEQINERFRA